MTAVIVTSERSFPKCLALRALANDDLTGWRLTVPNLIISKFFIVNARSPRSSLALKIPDIPLPDIYDVIPAFGSANDRRRYLYPFMMMIMGLLRYKNAACAELVPWYECISKIYRPFRIKCPYFTVFSPGLILVQLFNTNLNEESRQVCSRASIFSRELLLKLMVITTSNHRMRGITSEISC